MSSVCAFHFQLSDKLTSFHETWYEHSAFKGIGNSSLADAATFDGRDTSAAWSRVMKLHVTIDLRKTCIILPGNIFLNCK
jgi:hypothetical protein